jgi:hypothetical protein
MFFACFSCNFISDGSWSTWADFGPCKAIKTRTRSCNSPKDSVGGKPCSGVAYEEKECALGLAMHFWKYLEKTLIARTYFFLIYTLVKDT